MPVAAGLFGINATIKEMQLERDKMQRAGQTAIAAAARAAIKSYHKNSPVWSGETVRNYKVQIGGSKPGYSIPSGGRVDFHEPGWSGDTSLQNERRRAANEQASYSEATNRLKALRTSKKLEDVAMFMNKRALIEAVQAPKPRLSRYPGGLTKKAEQAARKELDKAKNPK